MSEVKGQKLKRLYLLYQDVPITSKQLKQLNISSSLVCKYVESGWLEKISKSVYKFPKKQISFEGIIHVLQKVLRVNAHPGAKSSLSYQNIIHYLKENNSFYIYGQRLPKWTFKTDFNFINIRTHKWNDNKFLYNPGTKPYEFYVARREIAIIQMIEQIGRYETFNETAKIFELLQDLNPDLVNKGLKIANKKAKRIFLFFTEYFNMPWEKDIKNIIKNRNSVIVVDKGGKYIKDYNLIIPEDFGV